MEGVVRMRGMWKTFADMLGDVSALFCSSSSCSEFHASLQLMMRNGREDIPIAYDTDVDLLVCHDDYIIIQYRLHNRGQRNRKRELERLIEV